jgi:hypothetical protein
MRKNTRFESAVGISDERADLARRAPAAPPHLLAAVFEVGTIELAYAVVTQARPVANGPRTRFQANHPHRKLEFGLLPAISVVGRPHALFLTNWSDTALAYISH